MLNADSFKPSNSKIDNLVKVIRYLRLHGTATVAEISQGAVIPLATTYRCIHSLLEDRIIFQSEKVTTLNGRQPIVFSIDPNYSYAISVILQKTSCSICLSNLDLQIIQQDFLEFKSKWEKDAFLRDVDHIISKYIAYIRETTTIGGKLRGIHIAVEADVDILNGRIIHFSGADSFDNFEVVSYFRTRYNTPAYLDKLLYVEALAAVRKYCRYEFDNYVYLHIGVGFGAAIVINGKIYTGFNGKAGELVHLLLPDGRSWEEAYSTENLYQRLVQIVAGDPSSQLNSIMMQFLSPSHNGNKHSLMSVLEYAIEENCREAIDIVAEATVDWAKAINLLYAFYDPEVIVIGGDISSDFPHIFSLLRKTLVDNFSFNGSILPAQYETSLIKAVVESTIDTLYESIYNEYIFSSVH